MEWICFVLVPRSLPHQGWQRALWTLEDFCCSIAWEVSHKPKIRKKKILFKLRKRMWGWEYNVGLLTLLQRWKWFVRVPHLVCVVVLQQHKVLHADGTNTKAFGD